MIALWIEAAINKLRLVHDTKFHGNQENRKL